MKAVLLGLALIVAGAAQAAPKTTEAQARYQKERATCLSGASSQDRATCLREAGAARAEARRGALEGNAESDLAANRTLRCNAQPAADRQACLSRLDASAESGTAAQGGILRETTQPVIQPQSKP